MLKETLMLRFTEAVRTLTVPRAVFIDTIVKVAPDGTRKEEPTGLVGTKFFDFAFAKGLEVSYKVFKHIDGSIMLTLESVSAAALAGDGTKTFYKTHLAFNDLDHARSQYWRI